MVTETRKQREYRLREHQILEIARRQVVEDGYLKLSMDRIANEMEYSKGTIYHHFPNKEEIILALANNALVKRTKLFELAACGKGSSRVRIANVGAAVELFVELHPAFFVIEQVIRASSIWEKTTPERREIMRQCEAKCTSIVGGVVRDGIAQGDLSLDSSHAPEDVVFGLWSMCWGAQTIIHSSDSLNEVGLENPNRTLRTNLSKLLDGYNWCPLSTEMDYYAVMDQAKTELLAKENDDENA